MVYYCGIDVASEHSSVFVVNASGLIVREATVSSETEALGKLLPAQEVRAMSTARKLVQSKLHDVEMSVREILCSLTRYYHSIRGLRVGFHHASHLRGAWWSLLTLPVAYRLPPA